METSPPLGPANAAFGLAAAITVLFNTIVACAKDASAPLKHLMALPTGSDWTTQGIADVILFVLLGLILSKTAMANIKPGRLISFLVGSAIIAGAGLFAWYALY